MTRDPRDTAIVERARRGDRAAFDALVGRHLEDAHRLASVLAGGRAADAVVEDVFAAAWHELPRLQDAAAFGPWLESILVGVYTMHARREGLEAVRSAQPGVPANELSRLDEAFDRLEPLDRAALSLLALAGRDGEEIARIVHEPVGLVGVRLAESKAELGVEDAGAERLRAMLDRRITPPAPDLRARIAARVASAPQARAGRDGADRLLAPLVLVLALVLVGSGGYLLGRLSRQEATAQHPQPAFSQTATASGQAAPSQSTDDPQPTSEESVVPIVHPTAPPALTIDQMAVVTAEGFNLRVRSQPGVGDASGRLQPLLAAGTRMLVLRGPTNVDTHDWYQVKLDSAPSFGWVAAAGGGVAWLVPAAPRCSGAREPRELWTRSAMDLLACYGQEPFAVQVVGIEGRQATPCASAPDRTGCKAEPRWLLEPMTLRVVGDTAGAVATITVAVPDSAMDAIKAASLDHPLTILVALDRSAAQGCRVVDSAGLDVIPRDAAVATCRLTFAVVAMAR